MASKRAIRRKQCGEKVKYQTETEAARVIRGPLKGMGMGWYRCHFCQFWHIGHNPTRHSAGRLRRSAF